jgi:hypothetical protein
MLRVLALLLLLANGGYFAWSQGYLLAYGFGPAARGEPQRLTQQIRPNDIQIVGIETTVAPVSTQPESSAPGTTPNPSPSTPSANSANCLQAGPFDMPQASALRRTLDATLPAESWRLEPATLPARWIIYMGKYESAEAVIRKKMELRSLNVASEAVLNASLAPGVSLGSFDTQAAADAGLIKLTQRGVRTARVVQEHVEVRGQMLLLPQADDSLRSLMDGTKPALLGKPLVTCTAATATAEKATATPRSP